jgi:hypothetical protein
LTETPITASSGGISYFSVTTTNAAASGRRIVFEVRLCEHADSGGTGGNCSTPSGGITKARCSPLPGSNTCSWVGKVPIPYEQWQPATLSCPAGASGSCYGKDPLSGKSSADYGLIDIVAAPGCGSTCPGGTYDPGNVSWSVAYVK